MADAVWGAKAHPPWQVHQLMADVVVYYLQKAHARFLEVIADSVPGWVAQHVAVLPKHVGTESVPISSPTCTPISSIATAHVLAKRLQR